MRKPRPSEDEPAPTLSVGPGRCNNSELRKATRHLGLLFDEVMRPSGLRAAQHGILYHVKAMDRPTMKALARELVMDLSALGHTLKPLARDGFVRLDPDDRDARAKRVSLTPAGEAKLRETTALWRSAQTRVETALGADKAQAMRTMLAEVSSNAFGTAFRSQRGLD